MSYTTFTKQLVAGESALAYDTKYGLCFPVVVFENTDCVRASDGRGRTWEFNHNGNGIRHNQGTVLLPEGTPAPTSGVLNRDQALNLGRQHLP